MMNNVSATGSAEATDAPSEHASSNQPSVQSRRLAVSPGLAGLVRNEAYKMRQARFKTALESNAVGRGLLQDPRIVNSRLSNDPSQPPVYQGGENEFEGVINLRDKSSFPSEAEHHATFTHEALHKLHHMEAPAEYARRKQADGTHPGWSNAEEEYTITGTDPSATHPADPAPSENAARTELGLNERNSHFAVHDDLPHRMTNEQYRAHRRQDQGEALLQVANEAPSRPMPARLRARLEAQRNNRG
ncbi:hypothetical protein [Trinickia fusca]|uniref:Uncharacterized protein n=1 Tax=Trinickia fusca TaxID=2419777 RepID=A0A494XF62_9BURK|nr:hypothetical protein [Trinickia fusca]RKP48321.1 hypothetical protein D7S89_13465 [Trinickia fusca]